MAISVRLPTPPPIEGSVEYEMARIRTARSKVPVPLTSAEALNSEIPSPSHEFKDA